MKKILIALCMCSIFAVSAFAAPSVVKVVDTAEEIGMEFSVPEAEAEAVESAELMENSGTCGANVTWTLDDEGTLTISGTGEMKSKPWNSMKSSIKSVIIEDGVTSICGDAFYYCNNLKSIEIADSVNYIGSYAFCWCNALEEIVIPVGVTSINYYTFYYCQSLTKVVIPETVTSIGSEAFYGCKSLTEVIIPNSVISIGEEAFANSGLTKVNVPSSVKTIGYDAFYSCDNLADINIPDSVTSIGREAFSWTAYYNDTNNWDNGVLYIDNCLIKANETLEGDYSVKSGTTLVAENAFNNCTKVTSIELPDSIVAVGRNAFSGTAYYTNTDNWQDGMLYIGNCLVKVDANLEGNCSIKSGTTFVADYAFYENYNTFDIITVPDSIKRIGRNAFRNMNFIDYRGTEEQWKNIAVGDGNYSLEYATIMFNASEHATENGKFLVEGNKIVAYFGNDETIIIPEIIGDNVITKIGDGAFSGNESIKKIVIGENITYIGGSAFCDCTNISEINIPSGVTSIEECAFRGLAIEKISIPEGVTVIKNEAFMGCTNLSEISLPSTLTEIWGAAFWGTAYEGNDDNYEDGVLYIGEYLIYVKEDYDYYEENKKMPVINIKEGTVLIADGAFGDYVSEVNIPSSLKYISFESFDGTNNLESINVSENNPYYSSADGVLYNKDKSVLIRFCSASTTLTTFVVPTTVKCINPYSFDYMSSAKTIIVPATVETIYLNSFDYWDSDSLLIFDGTREELDDINYKYYDRWDQGLSDEELQEEIEMLKSAFSLKSNLYQTENGYIVFDNYRLKKYNGSDLVVEIPASFKGVSITEISDSAFSQAYNLTNITIPEGITQIGYGAFSDCKKLTNIDISDSVNHIGDYAFSGCEKLTNIDIPENVNHIGDGAFSGCEILTNIYIPKNVNNIGNSTFYKCSSLASIVIPDSVTDIGSYAFYNCTGLETVSGGNNVESIGNSAFYNCTSLADIVIPNSVTNIGSSAFYNCTGLTDVEIPKGVSYINSSTFYQCNNLKSITLPKSITSIGYRAFYNCEKLQTIRFYGSEEKWNSIKKGTDWDYNAGKSASGSKYRLVYLSAGDNIDWKLDGNGVLTISGSGNMTNWTSSSNIPWYEKRDLIKEIVIADGINNIGDGAFQYCKNVSKIVLPDSVTSIGKEAFRNCTGLIYVVIPDSVTSIGEKAFYNCHSMDRICYTGTSAQWNNIAFGNNCFYNCGSTTSTSLAADVIYNFNYNPSAIMVSGYFGENIAWKIDYSGKLVISGEGEMPEEASGIDHPWWEYRCLIKEVVFEGNVSSICDYAFSECTSLERIIIPDSVTYISYGAFEDCTSLTNISIPQNVKAINTDTFNNCIKLASVVLPDGVKSIGREAFYNCTSLVTITIPTNTSKIDGSAFGGCINLTKILVDERNQYFSSIDGVLFDKNKTTLVLYPFGKKENTYIIPDGVTNIGASVFGGCKSLTSITIPDSVISIGDSAFGGCTNLTNISIGKGVTTIGNDVFSYCTSLPSITIPENVISIGPSAFWNCHKLSNIVLPDTLTYIGYDAFGVTAYSKEESNWENGALYIGKHLISVDNDNVSNEYIIKDGTLCIAGNAFEFCNNLTNVVIPDSVTNVGSYAFWYCKNLEKITISKNIFDIDYGMFSECHSLAEICYSGSAVDWSELDKAYNWDENAGINTTLGTYTLKFAIENHISVTEITLDKASDDILVGETLKLNATILPETATNKNVVWTSSDTSVATVSNGLVTAKGAGTAIITVTTKNGGKTASCTVNVTGGKFSDDFVWTFDSTTGELTISGNGAMEWSADCVAPWRSIRESVNSINVLDGVTTIGPSIFYGCINATTLSLPSSLTTIEAYAFQACSDLKEVTIPDSVTSIGNGAFKECTNLTIYGHSGSFAETYASENNIPFVILPPYTPGELNADGVVDMNDAILLLQHSMFPELYPIDYEGSVDFTGDGAVDMNDAILLLQHSMFPELYPIE